MYAVKGKNLIIYIVMTFIFFLCKLMIVLFIIRCTKLLAKETIYNIKRNNILSRHAKELDIFITNILFYATRLICLIFLIICLIK